MHAFIRGACRAQFEACAVRASSKTHRSIGVSASRAPSASRGNESYVEMTSSGALPSCCERKAAISVASHVSVTDGSAQSLPTTSTCHGIGRCARGLREQTSSGA